MDITQNSTNEELYQCSLKTGPLPTTPFPHKWHHHSLVSYNFGLVSCPFQVQLSGLWLLFRLYLPLFLNISSLATLDQGLITTPTW